MAKLKNFNIYSFLISCLGLVIVLNGFNMMNSSKIFVTFIFFVFLSILTESLSISLNDSTYISLGFAVGLAVLIIFHPFITASIMFIGTVLCIYKEDKKYFHIFNSSIYKRIFNGSARAISYLIAGYAYSIGSNILPGIKISNFNVLGIVLTIITYVFFNTLVYMILFSMLQKQPFRNLMVSNIWVVKNFFAIAPIGIFMAISYINYGWFALILFLGPLLLARYSFKLYLDMRNVYFETIRALSNAVDAKDNYTNGHSHRVAYYADLISRQMGLTNKRIDVLKTAAILHDIGKIGVEDHILNKPGNLTPNELQMIQQHPLIGAKILKDVDFLGEAANIIKFHHERYDGMGYPDGLKAGEIPIEAAILAVADAFDAMTSNRPYRNAMTFDAAMKIIMNEAGSQFNPIVAKTLKDLLDNNREMLINVS